MASMELKLKLQELGKVFDLEKIASLPTGKKYIQKYYKVNQIPYSIFHTDPGFIHMGISRDGIYKHTDLLVHADLVHSYIQKTSAGGVLELATGRGANSIYLAKKNPSVAFDGIDLSPGQLHYAHKQSKSIVNFSPTQGDFHDLSRYASNSMDVIFVVEAFCYSKEKHKAFSEISRVLKDTGYFIVFDGYRNRENLDADEELACRLTEKGMAVEKFDVYDQFVQTACTAGFSVDFEENLSQYIIPTLQKFEVISKRFIKRKWLAKIGAKLLPNAFMYNIAPGYIMPTSIKDGIGAYWLTVFKK